MSHAASRKCLSCFQVHLDELPHGDRSNWCCRERAAAKYDQFDDIWKSNTEIVSLTTCSATGDSNNRCINSRFDRRWIQSEGPMG
jgi:hypothetical protein